MARINLTRVVLGGLVAGVVIMIGEFINGLVTGNAFEEILAALGVTEFSTGATIALVMIAFVEGIIMIWLYAAIRPRFGPGIQTALIAGFFIWIVAAFLTGVQFIVIGVFPMNAAMAMGSAISLVQLLAASTAGAWIYKEP